MKHVYVLIKFEQRETGCEIIRSFVSEKQAAIWVDKNYATYIQVEPNLWDDAHSDYYLVLRRTELEL